MRNSVVQWYQKGVLKHIIKLLIMFPLNRSKHKVIWYLGSGHHRLRDYKIISLNFSFADEVRSFLGNQTHKDHFKLLQSDGISLLIGARNVIYNLSIFDLTENIDQVRIVLHTLQLILTKHKDKTCAFLNKFSILGFDAIHTLYYRGFGNYKIYLLATER